MWIALRRLTYAVPVKVSVAHPLCQLHVMKRGEDKDFVSRRIHRGHNSCVVVHVRATTLTRKKLFFFCLGKKANCQTKILQNYCKWASTTTTGISCKVALFSQLSWTENENLVKLIWMPHWDFISCCDLPFLQSNKPGERSCSCSSAPDLGLSPLFWCSHTKGNGKQW